MHEAGIMESTLALAAAKAREQGAERIHRIVLRLGALSGVEPDALRFAFDAMAKNTPAAGAVLEIETVPACGYCPDCDLEFAVKSDFIFTCPKCGRISGELNQGRELELARLEIS
ncbi:MAG TPA: hydrogenase maturation nickel metallochaperone HypA [Opitutaceae bacterium]|nr:hydrogenase maturation nickel metallochaperone HypA [Opitutaceae bacterium]